MKFKATSLSSFNDSLSLTLLLTLSLSLLLISVKSYGQVTTGEKADRWFEVEVILFKQLGNKDEIKEKFPNYTNKKSDDKNNTQHKTNDPFKREGFFDLLTPYLQSNQSNLTNIKQNLPQCSQKTNGSAALIPNNNTLELEKLPLEIEDSSLNINCFGVSELPKKLNALGNHSGTDPYLINDDSLRLTGINKKLQWSKAFEPLLHFGWRQIGITKKKAIALKLFAGEHLEYTYQQANDEYQTKLSEAQLVEEKLAETIIIGQAPNESLQVHAQISEKMPAELDYNTGLKQQKFQLLFDEYHKLTNENVAINTNEAKVSDKNIINIIAELEQQTLSSLLANSNSGDSNKIQTLDSLNPSIAASEKPPKKPLQPWFLEGFFKVNLDHYLYITADFNLFNDSKLALNNIIDSNRITEDKNSTVNLINFSQNRRVITGEIHYFDHPYVGMIVQIRRFDPTKPADEAVTQAIK